MKTSVAGIMRMLVVFSFGLIGTNHIHAQVIKSTNSVASIGSLPIELTVNKTSNIIFPYTIKSVDRGSGDVLAQVVKGFGNILQLKANAPDFKQTNVTVITSDGKFYSFLADYSSDPKILNLSFIKINQKEQQCNKEGIADNHYNDAVLQDDCSKIKQTKSFLHKNTRQQRMKLRLAGIYLKDGLMWFKLDISNQSQVGFEIDNISFSLEDKRQVKRTARQEIQLQAVYTKELKVIKGNASNELLMAFKPLTLSHTKYLKIQVSDKTGGRNLILSVKAKKLLRTRLLK